MDLEPFDRINPCGMAGLAMTQLASEGARTDVADAARDLAPIAVAALGLEWNGVWSGPPGAVKGVKGDVHLFPRVIA
jgi:lipoate-protein ligase B